MSWEDRTGCDTVHVIINYQPSPFIVLNTNFSYFREKRHFFTSNVVGYPVYSKYLSGAVAKYVVYYPTVIIL